MKIYGLMFNFDGNKQKGFVVYNKNFDEVIGSINTPVFGSDRQTLKFFPDEEYTEAGNGFSALELNDICIFMQKQK